MNNKLTKVETLYVPVSVEIEVPEHKKDVFAFHDVDKWESQCYIYDRKNNKEKWVNSWDNYKDECFPTHWLKEQNNKYILSEEDIIKLISDACGTNFQNKVQEMCGMVNYEDLKEQYINSILNK